MDVFEGHFHSIDRFVQEEQIKNDPIKLIVSGKEMIVGRKTLTLVPGSRLCDMFADNVPLNLHHQEKVFIDRNAEVFEYVIDYLRSDRRSLPKEGILTYELQDKIEKEIEFWKLYRDVGLKDYKNLTMPF